MALPCAVSTSKMAWPLAGKAVAVVGAGVDGVDDLEALDAKLRTGVLGQTVARARADDGDQGQCSHTSESTRSGA